MILPEKLARPFHEPTLSADALGIWGVDELTVDDLTW